MKELTREMVHFYKIDRLMHDFLGYKVHNLNNLSYHHTIVPKRHGGKRNWENFCPTLFVRLVYCS